MWLSISAVGHLAQWLSVVQGVERWERGPHLHRRGDPAGRLVGWKLRVRQVAIDAGGPRFGVPATPVPCDLLR
jgi:hypothetical protein